MTVNFCLYTVLLYTRHHSQYDKTFWRNLIEGYCIFAKIRHFVSIMICQNNVLTLHNNVIAHYIIYYYLYYYWLQIIRVCKVMLIKSRGELSRGCHMIESARNLRNRVCFFFLIGTFFFYFFCCFFAYLTRRTRWNRPKQFFIANSWFLGTQIGSQIWVPNGVPNRPLSNAFEN